MSGGMAWQVPPEQAFTGLYDQWHAAVLSTVHSVCQATAPQAENWMKQNAPWTDRTGNARQSLNAHAEIAPPVVRLVLDHGMEYGKYLEFKHAGRFAIVGPAVDVFTPRIMQAIQAALR